MEPMSGSMEEALEEIGSGRYNIMLGVVCAFIQLASSVDMLGSNMILPLATCDLHMTLMHQGLISSLPFVGLTLLSYWWGYLADTRGRKFVLRMSMTIGFVVSCLCSLATSWQMLAVLKFISVTFSCASNSAAYLYLAESSPTRNRSRDAMIMSCISQSSQAVIAMVAFPILKLNFLLDVPFLGITYRPWRLLMMILSLPSGISAVALPFFYESPKFLASHGHDKEALEVLRKIYAINKSASPENFPFTSVLLEETIVRHQPGKHILHSLKEQTLPLFRPPLARNTFMMCYLLSIIFLTANSTLMWMPHIFTAFFNNFNANVMNEKAKFCDILNRYLTPADHGTEFGLSLPLVYIELERDNVLRMDQNTCTDHMSDFTFGTMFVQSLVFTTLCLLTARLCKWKKKATLSLFTASGISAILVRIMPEPISSLVFFFIVRSCSFCFGIIIAYCVQLFPSAYGSMAACLSMMCGRLCSFIAINVMGQLIFTQCRATFYTWAMLLFSGVAVAYFLPPD